MVAALLRLTHSPSCRIVSKGTSPSLQGDHHLLVAATIVGFGNLNLQGSCQRSARDFPVSKRLEGRLFMSPGGCVDQLEGHHCGGKLVVVRLVLDQHCPVAWPDGCCLSHENPKWHLVSLKLRDSASHRSKAEWLYLHLSVRPSRIGKHLHLSPLYDVLDHTNHTFSESL